MKIFYESLIDNQQQVLKQLQVDPNGQLHSDHSH